MKTIVNIIYAAIVSTWMLLGLGACDTELDEFKPEGERKRSKPIHLELNQGQKYANVAANEKRTFTFEGIPEIEYTVIVNPVNGNPDLVVHSPNGIKIGSSTNINKPDEIVFIPKKPKKDDNYKAIVFGATTSLFGIEIITDDFFTIFIHPLKRDGENDVDAIINVYDDFDDAKKRFDPVDRRNFIENDNFESVETAMVDRDTIWIQIIGVQVVENTGVFGLVVTENSEIDNNSDFGVVATVDTENNGPVNATAVSIDSPIFHTFGFEGSEIVDGEDWFEFVLSTAIR